MEHVLRQCLIALRLAEGIGVDDQQRAVAYYTALLVNVGCHSDADVIEALGAAYERWDGRGWPGVLDRDKLPVAARLAQMAE